jgi:glutathione S-transferase
MPRYKLVIGNKAYSSWSLRAWLVLRQSAIPFEEIRIPLFESATRECIRAYSPAGKVPVLLDTAPVHAREVGDSAERHTHHYSTAFAVWESLAIGEYLAEQHPEHRLWPAVTAARAHARSISAEMHSGFTALRAHMTMNVRASFPGAGRTPEVEAEIARIDALWSDCLQRYGGPFLFGADFCIADAMYAPVATRFKTYAVGLSESAQQYADRLLALPAMREWVADAMRETEVIVQYENRK